MPRKSPSMSAIISSVSSAPVIASSPAGNARGDLVAQRVLADAVGAGDPDRRDLAGPPDERRRIDSSVNAVYVVGPRLSAPPNVASPTIDHVDRLRHLHDGLVADVQVAVLGGRAVDHDLVRLPGADVARRSAVGERATG